jgi:NHS family xanthosine MFS transporter
MGIKYKLTLMSFLQFFVWGAWLITIGNYWFGTKHWSGAEFGAIFSTLGLSSIFMPALTGIIADKWINAERLYGVLHIIGGIAIAFIPMVDNPNTFFWVIFGAMLCYMPTISLSNSIAYNILKSNQFDVVKVFPPIRVWGTVGFIAAMWLTNLTGNKASGNMFYISAIAAIILGVYSFTLPQCKAMNLIDNNSSWIKKLGLEAFGLFGTYKMALFFLFSLLLGAALQLTNMYGDVYISDFGNISPYKSIVELFNLKYLPQIEILGSFWEKFIFILKNIKDIYPALIVKYSTIIMSISQISETLFILAIPFFLKRFGIKQVMLISMLAWVLRFALFSFGNPAEGLWMIIASCIVYGMAFDFFNISGSLFVETTTDSKIRSSAQGLFMMMSNGFGAIMGSFFSGLLIDHYFTINGIKDWHSIWLAFAGYALVIAILFAVFFKHQHKEDEVCDVSH